MRQRWTLRSGLVLLVAVACSELPEPAPTIHAEEGATQPAGNGRLIGEQEACERLLDALLATETSLGCDALERPACPELIRPAGSDACASFEYDEGSVDACVDVIESFAACAEFQERRCIATAVGEGTACNLGGAAGATNQSGGAAGATETGR